MATKAYSYLRFSTPEQMRGDSFRRQTQLAKQYAASHKLQLDDKLTFDDLGVSAFRGANVEVGQLGAFLEAVNTGVVESNSFLLVESLDRVSRDTAYDAQLTLQNIINTGVTVVTLLDGKEYSRESVREDPMAIVYSLMVFMRAHDESKTKSRRLKASWDGKRARVAERPLTALTPGWIELRDGELRLIAGRAKIVRGIFESFLGGAGQESIARGLNEASVPTFGRSKMWHRSYIQKTLSNVACVGTFIPHEVQFEDGKKIRVPLDPVPNYFPAAIDEETFERAQSLIQQRGNGRGRHSGKAVRSIIAGLGSCPLCGSTMTRVTKGSSTVNQASITGESIPVDKEMDGEVYAGTENLTGMIELKVTGVGQDTTLGKVRDLIQKAERTQLPIARLIDKYIVYYTPIILMTALLIWFLTEDWLLMVLVLVISCPCAVIVATPSANIAAIA